MTRKYPHNCFDQLHLRKKDRQVFLSAGGDIDELLSIIDTLHINKEER